MNKTTSIRPHHEWFSALTLEERLSIRPNETTVSDPELAEMRFTEWKSAMSAESDAQFLARMGNQYGSEADLQRILGEPADALTQRAAGHVPDWLERLLTSLMNQQPFEFEYTRDMVHTDGLQHFLSLVRPLLSPAVKQLQQRLRQSKDSPLTESALKLMIAGLPGQLSGMLARTAVLELHVARINEELTGDTPEQRFNSFLERLETPQGLAGLFQEYPVLARQLDRRVRNWLNFNLKFIDQLETDWPEIRQLFFDGDDPGPMIDLDAEAGDLHSGGQCVRILTFESEKKLVYKPRSLVLDQHFQQLLDWINQRQPELGFKTLYVLERGDHGWAEFAESHPCETIDQVQRYYRRQGGLLALLYAIQATDFHHENLIACGEHPVLVDLESLFQPLLASPESPEAGMVAAEMLGYSVLRVGLLPKRIGSDVNPEGTDFSGMGYNGDQNTPFEIPVWKEAGTDQMHLGRATMKMSGGTNLPKLRGQLMVAANHTAEIRAGFEHLYRLLLKHQSELLAVDGPIQRFAGDKIRVILRPTRTYALMLQESFHPDVLRDGLDRDQHFDRLWRSVKHRPFLKQAIISEKHDLRNGDIPIFFSETDSHHIWDTRDELIGRHGIDQTGMQRVTDRISQLSDEDLQRQLWLVDASLGTLGMTAADAGMPSYLFKVDGETASRETLLAAACDVGNRLSSVAMIGDSDACWLGLQLEYERYWTVVDLLHDLYGGMPGIVLFMAYLGKVSGDVRYTELARKGWRTLDKQLESSKSYLSNIGGYEGWGGVFYALTHLGSLWDEPEILDLAESYVDFSEHLIEKDEHYDILSGCAGYLAGVLSLYHVRPNTKLLSIAKRCGHHLIHHATDVGSGIGWIHPSVGDQPLTGFSHGNAGVAWALTKLSEYSGEQVFADAALRALAYERSLYSEKHRNWPDLRENPTLEPGQVIDPDRIYPASWCHGAVGIGMSRVGMLGCLQDDALEQEIRIAVETTCVKGFGHNHCLCHGDLGNLDLLLMASEKLDDSGLRAEVYRRARAIIQGMRDEGWLTGVPEGVETTGLMNGISGTGWQLLRLSAPEVVPSVLTLEPPKAAS